MDESILSLIVNFMTDIKLDEKVMLDEPYLKLQDTESTAEDDFKETLSNKQKKEYYKLSDLREERSARYNILAYQQGMKDLFQFLVELAQK